MAIATNRIRDELGHGLEALRSEAVTCEHTVAGSQTPVAIIGPFDVDVYIRSIWMTAGLVPADNAGNLINIYNGTVAGAVKLVNAYDYHAAAPTAQVPVSLPLVDSARKLTSGTILSIAPVMAGNDSAAGAQLRFRVNYEVAIQDPNAKSTTYGAYDQAAPD